MEKAIGGYFELELPNLGSFIHDDGLLLNSGRNAWLHILKTLEIRHLWVPYYTCGVILSPLRGLSFPCSFYHIDKHLDIQETLSFEKGDFLLYTNYFGIKDSYISYLAEKYKYHLIVDNSQALFSDPIRGVPTFYSPRKYVGVPDGGIAFCCNEGSSEQYERDQSVSRCSHLLKRIDLGPQEGYLEFQQNDRSLETAPICQMSALTKRLLYSIDFDRIKESRRRNFFTLLQSLQDYNLLPLPEMDSFHCPMVYPFMTYDTTLKERLIANNIFVATYWPDVIERVHDRDIEYSLVRNLIAIPCDQRYDESDMRRIISIVLG